MTTRNGRVKRRMGAVVLAALVGSLLAFASPATAVTAPDVAETHRFAGADRYATAADAYTDVEGWDCNPGDVVVVSGEKFPDGLSAAVFGLPILLVKADSIPAATEAALKLCETTDDVGDIIIVGGTNAVSSAVLEDLDALNGAGDDVSRIGGADRIATSVAVAGAYLKYISQTNTCDMIVATASDFPDALAAGPLSHWADAPILLTSGSSLRADVKATIANASGTFSCEIVGGVTLPPTIHVVGGEEAVPGSIVAEIQAMGLNVIRWAGDNRAETAAAIAGALKATGYGPDSVALVNGYGENGFADALAAGPVAYENDSVILLTNANAIPAATAAWHVANCSAIDNDPDIYAVGGTVRVSDAVLAGAGGAATCVPPIASATLTTVNNSQAKYEITEADNDIDTGEGITLTAVAGSAADGAAGNSWTINIVNGTATGGSSNIATRTVTLAIKGFTAAGISQADLVAAWNGDPATKALFKAAPNGTSGSPLDYDGSALQQDATVVVGKTTQTIVVTFNQDVDDCAAAPNDDVLDATDFTFPNTLTPSIPSDPLPGTAGGASVYTFTFVLTNVADVMVGGLTGDTMSANAGCSVANGGLVTSYPLNAAIKFG